MPTRHVLSLDADKRNNLPVSNLTLCVPHLATVQEAVPTRHVLSLDAYKRNNLAYIEDDVLVTSAGNNVIFIHLSDMTHRSVPAVALNCYVAMQVLVWIDPRKVFPADCGPSSMHK